MTGKAPLGMIMPFASRRFAIGCNLHRTLLELSHLTSSMPARSCGESWFRKRARVPSTQERSPRKYMV